MVARFDWRFRPNLSLARRQSRGRRAYCKAWLLIGGLTAVLALWLYYRSLVQPAWLARLPPVLDELLALGEAASAFTIGFLWFTLGWQHHRRRRSRVTAATPNVANLYALSPAEFERYVAGLFRQKGYQVKVRGRSGDHGVDLELNRPGRQKAIVQCKRYQNTIGPDVVRELFGTLVHERAAHAFLVTTADVSEAAREWARHKPITLIDGHTLVKIVTALSQDHD
ncbi:MAG TPA: restriction endonuclease [Anaerolineae bacterium]